MAAAVSAASTLRLVAGLTAEGVGRLVGREMRLALVPALLGC
jgi:hypothetical protein